MPARGSWRFTNNTSFHIACNSILAQLLSICIEELNVEVFNAKGSSSYDNAQCRLKLCGPWCVGEEYTSCINILESLLSNTLLPDIVYECSTEEENCMSISEVTSTIVKTILKEYSGRLLSLMDHYGAEVFLVIGWNGEAIAGVGEGDKIALPRLRTPIHIHTHPNGVCYPSWRDLEIYAGFFADGGIVAGVLSRNCASFLRLDSIFTEHDYNILIDVAKEAKKAREFEDYVNTLSKLSRLKGLSFEVHPAWG